MTEASDQLQTPRLLLRRPREADAPAILAGWASDPVATRYMSWPRHESLVATQDFIGFSDSEWARWPAGPLVIELRDTRELVGSTGFGFRSSGESEVGYIVALRFWRQGIATEALRALVELAPRLGLERLTASIHPDNCASARVLEKCSFSREVETVSRATFPNLPSGRKVEPFAYSRSVRPGSLA